MPTKSQPEILPINVSSRVLRHISRGIYRTPAGALKELVSNSYDAGAREVTVNTGWPAFAQMTVTDNGVGLSKSEFTDLIRRIGLSAKTAGETFELPDGGPIRTVIGHYGIGLLAVGQLAARMSVRSKKAGSRSGFSAELDFDQFEVALKGDAETARVRDEQSLESAETPQATFLPIGTCKVWSERYEPKDSETSFTRITLTRIREEVIKKLRGTYRDKHNVQAGLFEDYSASYADILELLRKNEALAQQGIYPYERLLWELGVYCPVAYPDIGLFQPRKALAAFAELASSHSFQVHVDGMQLRKPFEETFFDDDLAEYLHPFSWTDESYTDASDGPKVSAYLLFKPRIRPKALQGVLLREAGVAVGLYDTTYLEYPYNEGYKFNQLTGEVYAHGLSGALNIDRNSFNQTDDRYLALCDWLHTKLRTEVFPKIKELQSQPKARRRAENQRLLKATVAELSGIVSSRRKVSFRNRGRDRPLLNMRDGTLEINTGHPDGTGSGAKKEKVLLAAALVLKGLVDPDELHNIDAAIAQAKKRGKRR